jgi:hypothetical protein
MKSIEKLVQHTKRTPINILQAVLRVRYLLVDESIFSDARNTKYGHT